MLVLNGMDVRHSCADKSSSLAVMLQQWEIEGAEDVADS